MANPDEPKQKQSGSGSAAKDAKGSTAPASGSTRDAQRFPLAGKSVADAPAPPTQAPSASAAKDAKGSTAPASGSTRYAQRFPLAGKSVADAPAPPTQAPSANAPGAPPDWQHGPQGPGRFGSGGRFGWLRGGTPAPAPNWAGGTPQWPRGFGASGGSTPQDQNPWDQGARGLQWQGRAGQPPGWGLRAMASLRSQLEELRKDRDAWREQAQAAQRLLANVDPRRGGSSGAPASSPAGPSWGKGAAVQGGWGQQGQGGPAGGASPWDWDQAAPWRAGRGPAWPAWQGARGWRGGGRWRGWSGEAQGEGVESGPASDQEKPPKDNDTG
jgi:hypothetical protein